MPATAHFLENDLHSLIDSCVSFYVENKDQMEPTAIRERRAALSDSAEAFHKDCGTLTPSIEERIRDLRSGNGLLLMTAHQPNLFAYSGVFRKATVNFVLGQKIEEILRFPAVGLFGIADQDFSDDRWVRSFQLPAVKRRKGLLEIKAKLPERLMLNKIAEPSCSLLREWKEQIERWLDKAISSVGRLSEKQGLKPLPYDCYTTLHENFEFFWSIVEDCHELAENYSDFNAFVMSKIVNDMWGYDTLFFRFSQSQQGFADEFSFLLSHHDVYSRLLEEARKLPDLQVFQGGVSDQEPWLAPFWYHCDCGSKAKLFLIEEEESLLGRGNCLGCENYHEIDFGSKEDPDVSGIASRISARAIPMGLIFFKGLLPSSYVGGVGGIRYLLEAKHVARGLKIPFPPIVVWRPLDRYLGIGQLEAILEKQRICRDVGVHDLSTAKNLLESRIADTHDSLHKFEMDMERLENSHNSLINKELKKKLKDISLDRTRLLKASNLSVINRELKILDNVSAVLKLMPSILDYAVNIGLEGTGNEWVRHLIDNRSLSSDVYLKSVLDQDMNCHTLVNDANRGKCGLF